MATRKILKYDNSLVMYTDILGFGGLIQNETPGKISKILRVFKEMHQTSILFREPRSGLRHFVNFSDLCVITIPLLMPRRAAAALIALELPSLALAQARLLLEHNVIIRGGVTIGLTRTSRGLVYGPGIVEAYRLESKEAKYPRILISDAAAVELKRNRGTVKAFDRLVAKDVDGQLFLDYLGVAIRFHPTDVSRILVAHRRVAERGREKPEYREKYEWLLSYQRRTERTALQI